MSGEHIESFAEVMQKIRSGGFGELADHIEAAHRRELATLNLAVSSAHNALREMIEQNCSHCHKRELATAGNTAKLREALESIASNLEHRLFARYPSSASDEWMYQKANAALAAPPRNCEVGTPKEQSQRFDAFCVSHYAPPNKDGVLPDGCDCPCYVRGKGCNAFVWGQLPYVEKEGGAE